MKKLVRHSEARLAAAGNGNPTRSVEELAAHILGCKPLEIYFHELSPPQAAAFETAVSRAEQGEPIQYIIGHVDFRGLDIRCDRRALIPRPETELLVEAVLKSENQGLPSGNICDVGTGTGCVGLALLSELPNVEVTAIDMSHDALGLAKENAARLGLLNRFHCLKNNLLEGMEAACFDVVVSNPPYIQSRVCRELDSSVRDYEPLSALDGGADGLDLIRRLVRQAADLLRPGGGLFLEIGYDQGSAVSDGLKTAGFSRVNITEDYAGNDRIVSGWKG